MDKLKIFNYIKNPGQINNRNKTPFDQLKRNETHTPNKIPYNKTRTHIKIKSRDVQQESNLKTENNEIYSFKKPQLRQNKTLDNLKTIKLNREKKLKINLINRHNHDFTVKKNETYKKIFNLWKELGVNYIYQSIFNKTSNDLEVKEREEYFKYEFDKLNNIYNLIYLIKNDIKNRENIIYQLENQYKQENINNQKINDEALKQIVSIFNDIRKYSLDITYNILLLKKELGFDLSLNKYDLNKIFSFKKDYIIKINSDLDFLMNSSLNQFFSFEKSDPFFTKLKFNSLNSYNFPEIKDEKKIYIIKNFRNIFLDELINQNINLTNLNSNKNFDSIFNFKLFKPKKLFLQNNVIKAQSGLSRQKLKPRKNNKIVIEANLSNNSKTKTEIINTENIHNYNKKVFNTNINLNFNNKIKPNTNISQLDEDMKIFEKIIQQKIFGEQKNLTKELNRNKSYNKLSKLNLEEKKSSNNYINKKNKNSNFIQNIFDESEIELTDNNIISNNNTEILKENKIKKEFNNFTIELYNSKLSYIETLYKEYYKQIPEKIKYGFNIQSNIINYIVGIYPKILCIKSNKKNKDNLLGIITLNYISPNSNSISIGKVKTDNYNKILIISSISCINESQFEQVLLSTIEFCQEFFYFEIIFIELYYINKKGQFTLFTDLENIIKNKAKFKWVNMENDGINRKIKYKFVNNKIKDNNNKDNKNNILNLKTINIIAYEEENKFKKRDIRELSFINDFSFNYLLLEMIGQLNYKVNDNKNNGNNYINNLINKVTFKKINHICSDFLISQIGGEKEIEQFIQENRNTFNMSDLLDKINEKIFFDSYFSISILSINNSFKNIMKKKFDGYIYNILFSAQISEFSIQDKKNNELIFYLIKNPEHNSSIIIYELNDKQNFEDIINVISTNDGSNSSKNISEIFKDVFSLVNQKPLKLNKNIYIPAFKCDVNQTCFRPSVFKDVLLENDSLKMKYKINCINFIEEFTFGIDEPINIRDNIMDLDNFGNKDDIIIKHDFVINFVDNNLIFDLQIPTIATFFVEKKIRIKSD